MTTAAAARHAAPPPAAATLTCVAVLVVVLGVLSSCSGTSATRLRLPHGSPTTLPNVDACDDFATQLVAIDPRRPVVLLVHGCKASSSRFLTLAEVFRAHGQQALCFSYDDRRRLADSSAELIGALDLLIAQLHEPQIAVVGHSQGGLVARQALVARRDDGLHPRGGARLRLVTVSAPFNGIASAAHCGHTVVHCLSLGITAAVCHGITGAKWREIHPAAPLVTRPHPLVAEVEEHLLVVTDERNSCRRRDADGRCLEDDFVFSVEEQRNPVLGEDPRVIERILMAGHAEVVGAPSRPPWQLVELLQEDGIMAAAGGQRAAELRERLARLY